MLKNKSVRSPASPEGQSLLLPRRMLLKGTAVLTGLATVSFGRAALAAELLATPPQMEGPFFPEALPLDMDNDLVRIVGKAKEAFGKVTHIGGRVLDNNGQPVSNALVEIWQCDNTGKYNHSGDRQPQRFDEFFQGYGRTVTNENGEYRFRTIKPVPYPGRTPHIHFKVAAAGYEELTTQMYVAGEPLNRRDGILMSETPENRAALLVELRDAPELEEGALAGNFGIVLKPL